MPEALATSATTSTLDWLALSLTPGLGPTKARKLVEHFGSPEAVFRASLTELEAAAIQAVTAQSIATGKSAELGREELARAADAGITVLSASDPLYPRRLKEIYDPPIILYVRGDAEQLNKPGIAMVGTRHPTPYGSGMAERLACDLAAQGLVIISGMARGSIPPAIAEPSRQKARRLRCLARVWMSSTQKRIRACRNRFFRSVAR